MGTDKTVLGGCGDDGGGDEGVVLVVGVKLDGQSRELLTWSLVKMAQPGDRVIALHVLDSGTGNGNSGKGLYFGCFSLMSSFYFSSNVDLFVCFLVVWCRMCGRDWIGFVISEDI